MPEKVIILCPALNDNVSLSQLLQEFDKVVSASDNTIFSVLVVNDGSSEALDIPSTGKYSLNILHLQRNLGHQKAIAIGLSYIKDNMSCDKVVVMDCDGEDRPEDVVKLLSASALQPGKIIFGYRKSRKEGKRFLFFYVLYKVLFKLLTGQRINFGHFLLIPVDLLRKIVFYSEIWNHIPGGILKSGLPFTTVDTHRGRRFAGKSKMGFTSLVLHGFGAIAVFIDIIATRLLIFSISMVLISSLAILGIIGIKTFTSLAIPGWASTVASSLFIVLLQGFLLCLFTIFLYLSSQSQRKFIPAQHYKDYTGDLQTIRE